VWNPRRPPRALRHAPRIVQRTVARHEHNFGDLLGPVIVAGMLRRIGVPDDRAPRRRLLTVGSVLHLARPGDVVWGTGRNGREPDDAHCTDGLDVRAVRGPRTRDWLIARGVHVPEVFGDPALLLPHVRPDLVELAAGPPRGTLFVPHIDDPRSTRLGRLGRLGRRRHVRVLSPRAPVEQVLATIVTSEFVVATSLHAVIVAEAFGVPARSIVNTSEPEWKFDDHFAGTGRPDHHRAANLDEALALGGERPPAWDPTPLLDAFPHDCW
jgi:pyruvyltransferase